MKQVVLFGFFIMFISMNLYSFNNSILRESGTKTTLIQAVDGFSQFEMPIIKITTAPGDTINSKEEYTSAKISVINKQGVYEMTDSGISVRLRGNVTMMADKKSYKVKFEEKQNILNVGVGSAKTWCLISNC